MFTSRSCPVQPQSELPTTEQLWEAVGVKSLAQGHLSGGNEVGAKHCLSLSSPWFILSDCAWTCKSRVWFHILAICFLGKWKVGVCWKRSFEKGIKIHSPVPLRNDVLLWMLIPSSSVLFVLSSSCCFQGSSTPSPVLWPSSSSWCTLPWIWPAWLWNGPLHLISGTHVSLNTHTHTNSQFTHHNEGVCSTPSDRTFCSRPNTLLLFFIFYVCRCLCMCVRRWLFASWMLLWWQCTN